jgi:branched-chain amino acid transport system permease protein
MINKASGIFNFAHGAMMLVSALIFYSFFTTPTDSLSYVAVALMALGVVIMYLSMNDVRDIAKPLSLGFGLIVAVLLFIGMTIGSSTNSQLSANLNSAGEYNIVVTPYEELTLPEGVMFPTPESFSVDVTISPDGGESITRRFSGGLTPDSQSESFTIDVPANSDVTVTALSGNFDTVLSLQSTEGGEIATNDDRSSLYSFIAGIAPDFYKGSLASFELFRALIGGLVGAVLLGLMIERFSIRPLVGQPVFTLILMTLALDALFRGVSLMIWGSIDKPLSIFAGIFEQPGQESEVWRLPSIVRIDTSSIIESRITTVSLDTRLIIGFGIALLIFLVFVLFFQYTNVGLSMRATSENQVLAQSVGMRVRAILAAAWAIAALLALAAGVLYGNASNVGLSMPQLAILAFPAVLLGGLESIGGALIGGLIIGIVQTWADTLFGNEAGTRLAPYVILMVVLIIRPDGLFGQKRIERI